MKLLTILIAMLLALSLNAGSSENLASHKVHDSKPDQREPGDKQTGKPDKNHDRDKDDRHDPNDCDDPRHNHGNPKPPKPPRDDATIPTDPTQLLAEAVTEFQVYLAWEDNSSNELGFKIERSLDGTNFTQIAQVLSDTTTYRDLHRFPDTKYIYRARAFNAKADSADSNVARTQTPAPDCELSVSIQSPSYYGSSLNLVGAVAIAPGAFHNLILLRDGTVSLLEYGVLTNIATLSNVVAVAAGGAHSLALKTDGTVMAWGQNFNGQTNVPANLSGVTAIAAGSTHSLALKNDGTVVAWGNDEWWQARPPTNLTGVVAIAAGDRHSLALRSDGTVVGWGFNDQQAAQPPPNLREVITIAAGYSHSLALKRDGTVVSWGITEEGLVPSGLTNVTAIAAGQTQSFALKRDGTFAYWGSGRHSQLIPQLDLGGVVALASAYADHMFLTTLPPPPDLPRALLATSNRVDLTWSDYSNSTTWFEVKRSTGFAPNSFPGFPGSSPTNWTSLGQVAAGITRFTDATVVTGETYWYRINAQNDCGVSLGESDFFFTGATVITIAPPSRPPQIISAYAHANDIALNWFGENVGVTQARLERAPDANGQPGVWNEIVVLLTTSGASGNYTDVGLPPTSTNWYRVRIENGLGVSPYSDPVVAVIAPPLSPRYLEAHVGNTKQVILSWYNLQGSGREHYKVERADDENGNPGVWSEIAADVSPVNYSETFTDPNAFAGQTYWYRVRAFNGAGISDYSQPTSIALLPPAIPSLYAQPTSNAVLLAVWPYLAGESENPRFERAEDTANHQGEWHAITPEPIANTAAYLDRGLKNDVVYRYRVKVVNWLGESPYSEPVAIVLSPPPPPWFPRAMIGRSNYVKLLWRPGQPAEQTGFHIERALETGNGPGSWTRLATVGLTNSQYYSYEDLLNLSHAGRTYRYRISAFNVVGASGFTESHPVTLLPPPTPALSASSFKNQVALYWSVNFAGVMGFRLECAPDAGGLPGDWTQIAAFSPIEISTGNYTDIRPATQARYWYRVQADNWLGASEFSPAVPAQIQPPATPSLLGAKIGSTNEVVLFWDYVGSDVDELQVERAQYIAGGLGAWQQIARLTGFVSSFPGIGQTYTDSNAVAHAEYAYRVRAANAIGMSPYSEPFRVNVTPPPPLTTLQAAVHGGRASLSYYRDAGYYDYGEIFGFEVERAIELNGTPSDWTRIATAYDYAYIDNSLPPNSTCRYRVRVVNWVGGSDYLESASVTIVPPEPPRQLAAKVGGTNQVELSWLAPAANDQDGFLLELAEDDAGQPAAWQPLVTIGATNLWGADFIQTNAVAFTTNWYRVRAFNPAGVSAYSTELQFVVAPPELPQQPSVTAAADEARLFWSDYTAGEVGGFKVERALDIGGAPGAWTQIALVPATNSFSGWWYAGHVDSGLSVGTYWFRILAYNWVGVSAPSEPQSVTITPPPKPFRVGARVGTMNQAIVDWWGVLPTTNGGYRVERADDSGGVAGVWNEIAVITNVLTDSYYDTNVIAYRTNWYRVRAFNMLGFSPYSDPVPLRIIPPPAPWHVNATPRANRVNLFWADTSVGYGNVTGYEVERAWDTNGAPGNWETLVVTPNVIETNDLNLTASVTYWYRVRAFNWIGVGDYSPVVNVTINPPAAPYNLFAYVEATNRIRLQWYSGYADQDVFVLERTTDTNAAWAEIATIPATNMSYGTSSDTNVVADTTYYYRVRSFNIVGHSPYSGVISAVIQLPAANPIAPPPPQLLSLSLTNRDVLLTWTATGGTTNVVEATADLREGFVPISPEVILTGVGNMTGNFRDIGALTNSPTRFYRIRTVP